MSFTQAGLTQRTHVIRTSSVIKKTPSRLQLVAPCRVLRWRFLALPSCGSAFKLQARSFCTWLTCPLVPSAWFRTWMFSHRMQRKSPFEFLDRGWIFPQTLPVWKHQPLKISTTSARYLCFPAPGAVWQMIKLSNCPKRRPDLAVETVREGEFVQLLSDAVQETLYGVFWCLWINKDLFHFSLQPARLQPFNSLLPVGQRVNKIHEKNLFSGE